MARGGPRTGQAGKAYPNRSDLRQQAISTVPGQEYGKATQQANAQRAVPMAGMQPLPAPVPLDAPSQRPGEPVTAGLPIGPGPGSEVLPTHSDPTVARLRALYALHPTPDLRRLIAKAAGTGDPAQAPGYSGMDSWEMNEQRRNWRLNPDPPDEGDTDAPADPWAGSDDPWARLQGDGVGGWHNSTNRWHAENRTPI